MNKSKDQDENLAKQIKQSIFNVAYYIMLKSDQALITTILLSLMQFVQMIYFPFQIQMQPAWHNNNLSHNIQVFLQTFSSLKYIIDSGQFNIYLTVTYLAIGLLVVVLLLAILLVAGCQSNQQHQILDFFLNIIIKFFMTIGYSEILRLFLGYLTCRTNTNGVSVMLYLQNQECWTSNYTLHAIIIIFGVVLLTFVALIATKLCIEQKNNRKNTFAQKSKASYYNFFIYITLSMISYSIFQYPTYTIIVLLVQVFTSLFLFFSIHYYRPFYNDTVQKFWSITSGIVFYTNFMLFFSYFFEMIILQDTMIGWLVTTPMLIIILAKDQKISTDIFKIDLLSNCSDVEIIEKCDFLIDLAENYEKDQKKEILLSGFIEIHKCYCRNANCAIEVNEQLTKQFRNHPKYCDKKYILIELINQIYQDGLSKLPINVNLRIHYAYHLLDYMKQNYKAFSQLDIAEDQNPSIDQQFIIYRIKKMMQELIEKSQQNHDLQQVLANSSRFQFQFKQLQHLIEECSYLYQYFWNELLEETPNLQFLNSYGIQIISSKQQIRKQYAQMKRTGEVSAKAQRLISKFYQHVFHEVFLRKGDIPLVSDMKEFDYEKYIQDQKDLSCYSSPVLVLEIFSNNKQQTIIQNINQEVLSLLGFSRADLIGRHLSMIMPDIFMQVHNSRIESYFAQILNDEIDQVPKEKHFFLRTKTNYVVPVQIKSLNFSTEKGYFEFLQLRQDFTRRYTGYILFDNQGKIQNISSSCLFLMNLDERMIQSQQLMIQQVFPSLLPNISLYLGKMSVISQQNENNSRLSKSKDLESSLLNENSHNLLIGQLFEQSSYNVQTPTIKRREKVIGYVLKIEKQNSNQSSLGVILKQHKYNFQFRYNIEEKLYISKNQFLFLVESVTPTASQNESIKIESSICEDQAPHSLNCFSLKSKKSQTLCNIPGTKSNELGIKTMRWFQGQLVEVSDNENAEEDSELFQEQQTQKQQDNDQGDIQFNNSLIIKNITDLLTIIQSSSIPRRLQQSLFSSNFFMLFLTSLTIVMYIIILQIEVELKNGLSLLSTSNLRYGSILKIQSDLQEIRGCVLNYEVLSQGQSGGKFLQINREELQNELNSLIYLDKLLTSSTVDISNEYQNIIDDYQNSNIQVTSRNGDIYYFQYAELILQLISKAILLNSSNSDVFRQENEDFYFYMYNSFNSIPMFQHVSQNYYYYNIISLINRLNNYEDIFFVLATVCIILIYLSLQLYLYTHSISIKETLCLFLDLTESQVKQLQKETQSFIQSLQFDNNEEDEQVQEEYQDENDLEVEFVSKKKRKQFKFKIQDQLMIQVNWLIMASLVFSYFLYLYFSSITITDSAISLIPLINITSYLPAYYRLLDDSMKETILYNNVTILNQESSIHYLNQLVESAYVLNADLHVLNQQNENVVESQYKTAFYQIYFQNPCSIIVQIDTTQVESDCLNFYNKILQQGMAITVAGFLENERYLLQQYSYYDPSFEYHNLTFNISSDNRLNYALNILNTIRETSDRKIQKVYIKACHQYLINSLQQYLDNHFSTLQLQLAALFLVFCVVMFIFYFLNWIPFQRSMLQSIYRSRKLLQLIPIEYFQQLNSLQEFLRKIYY